MGNADYALFREVRILGDAALTCKPIDHQNDERGTVAACDVRARGQYSVLPESCEKMLVILPVIFFHRTWDVLSIQCSANTHRCMGKNQHLLY